MKDIKNIYVIGRQNPDLDSVASSIGYAELKNKIDSDNNYVAAASGTINLDTQKVLSNFSVTLPKYIMDLNLRVADVMTQNTIVANQDMPVTEVFKIMLKNDLRVIPITDNNQQFIGYFGMIDIAKKSISSVIPDIFRKIKTSVEMISKAIDGEILNNANGSEMFIANVVMGIMDVDGFMNIIQRFDPENMIMITGNRRDLQEKAIDIGVRCIIVSNGYRLDEELTEKAKQNGVSIILSEYDAFATAGLTEWSVPVSILTDKNSITAKPENLINDIKELVYASNNRSVIVTDLNNSVVGIITRTDIIKYNKRKVILMDHSSSSNSPSGIFNCNILEIIDHHKLGDIQTGSFTRYRIEPWGSTSSIVTDEFIKHSVKPSKTTALILSSGILVNTKCLSQNKTKSEDLYMIKWLCKQYDIDINNLMSEVKRIINL